MAFAVIMPKAGMSMESGTILRWLKKVGDPVKAGEPLLEIETDKVSMEVEAEASGVLLQILAQPGEVIPVTTVIGYLGEPGEQAREDAAHRPGSPASCGPSPAGTGRPAALAAAGAERPAPPPATAEPPAPPGGADRQRVAATPLARKLARQSGVDLAAVTPTGRHGEVKARDVLPAGRRAEPGGQGPGSDAITLFSEADVTELLSLQDRLNAQPGGDFTINAWLVRAAALSIRDCPALLPSASGPVTIGLRPDLDRGSSGLMVPDACSLTVRAISERLRGPPGPPSAPVVFAVTVPDSPGLLAFTPVLRAGQRAALGAGCVRESLAQANGAVVRRKAMSLCLTIDTRTVEAGEALRFLAALRALLENPVALLA